MIEYNIKLETSDSLIYGFEIIKLSDYKNEELIIRIDSENPITCHEPKLFKSLKIKSIRDFNGENIIYTPFYLPNSQDHYGLYIIKNHFTSNEISIKIKYSIDIDENNEKIVFDDSYFGGISCYVRCIKLNKLKNNVFDYEKSNYHLCVLLSDNIKIVTSGKLISTMTKSNMNQCEIVGYSLPSLCVIMAKNISRLIENVEGIKLICWYDNDSIEEMQYSQVFLQEAKIIIEYYKAKFRFYPSETLNIYHGKKNRLGGYSSTNIIFIHNIENINKSQEVKELFIKYILSHEIAHMYFGMYLNDTNFFPKWITIGLSIWASEEYLKHIGFNYDHKSNTYYFARENKINTSIFVPIYIRYQESLNWNKIIAHDKAIVIIKKIINYMENHEFNFYISELLQNYNDNILDYHDFISIFNSKRLEENLNSELI